MPKHVFGKSIDFTFVPTIDGDPVKVASLTSARIYSEPPTEAQIEDTASGHIEEITSWDDEGDYAKKITFSALTDDDPHSSAQYETFYVAVNFKYEVAGADKYLTESLHVYRPDALTSRITVSYPELLVSEPSLSQLRSSAQLEGFIDDARKSVFRRLKGLGYKKRRLFNLEEMNDATRAKALANACRSLISSQAPHWLDKMKGYLEDYNQIFTASEVGYDLDDDDDPSPGEHAETGTVYLMGR